MDALLAPLVPGYLQIVNGETEGYAYIAATPFLIAGGWFLLDYVSAQDKDSRAWELKAAGFSQAVFGAFEAYSLWAWFREYEDAYGAAPLRSGREPLVDLLVSPFDPQGLFDYRILPVLGLSVLSSVDFTDLQSLERFFDSPSVSWAGLAVNPWLGLAIQTTYAAITSAFVAVGEEALFRGMLMETTGIWVSAGLFGLAHLANILVESTVDAESLFRVLRQCLSSFVFGVYAGFLVSAESYSLNKTIAFHYWNNVITMVAGYVFDGGDKPPPSSSHARLAPPEAAFGPALVGFAGPAQLSLRIPIFSLSY